MPLKRRSFLKASATTLGFPAIVSSQSPNSKLQIAIIGAGGRGGSNLKACLGEDIVALCDVNGKNLAKAALSAPEARKYIDFRELYAAETDKIDAVVVSTTEHTHAFATLPALRAGKHVYCEKPLTRDVVECRKVIEAAAEAGVATQMGTQIHAGSNYRRTVELIQAGAIGNVSEVHVWVSRAWGWQSKEDAIANRDLISTQERPTEEMPVPADLDWDRWIGPAPWRPFHTDYFPGPRWYRWWDFGNGTMSDLGSHRIDLPFWALNLDAPLSIEAGGPPAHPEIAPASMWAKYEYGPRGNRPGLSLTWYQGTEKPEAWKNGSIPKWANGCLFVGDDGKMLLSDYSKLVLLPEAEFQSYVRPAETIPPSPGQQAEWIAAAKAGETGMCDFSYSGPLTEANHLGNVAFRAGKKLNWDTRNLKFTNAPEAEKFLGREYREGWSLEA
tara:strand:- start:26845 stop:28173 length:1329 start_codon:yes stop_codon:yes gene_type:complete